MKTFTIALKSVNKIITTLISQNTLNRQKQNIIVINNFLLIKINNNKTVVQYEKHLSNKDINC